MSEINKQIKERLEKYAPKLGKSVEDITKEFESFVTIAEEQYPTVKDKQKKALEMLVNAYRRKHGDFRRSKAEMYEGWLDGASPLRDQVQDKLRRITWRLKTEGRDALMFEGIIDENGTPLDDRPNIFGRRENTNFGSPLAHADPAYIRTLYGMHRKKGETGIFSPFQMTFFEAAAAKLKFKTNKFCEFRAGAGKKPGQLFGGDTTKFFPQKSDVDMDAEYELSGALVECSEIEVRMNAKNWDDRDVRVRADVVNINPNPLNDRGDRVMGIADLSIDVDASVSCFVPNHVNMDFGQDSKIVVVARAREYNNSGSLNVYGIWPVPGQIGVSELELISGEEEIIDVGWVDDIDTDFNLDLE